MIVTDSALLPADVAVPAEVLRRESLIHLTEARHRPVESRLHRLRERRCADFRNYVQFVRTGPAERAAMMVALRMPSSQGR